MKKWNIALILAGLLVLGMGGGVLAQSPTPTPAITQVVGTIPPGGVGADKVTIAPDGGGAQVVLNVTASTEIGVPGKDEATIADLLAGDRVKAKYETASLNALEIEVQAAKVQGEITALDAATNKVTIKPKVGDPVDLTVSGRTALEVWGKEPAVFGDLQVGQWARAEYNATSKEAYVIEVKGKGEPSLAVRQGFFGSVKGKTANSLTLDTKQGEVVLTLDANTQYWDPPKKDATLADVNVGDRAAVLAEKQQDGSLLAKRVLVIPPKPAPPEAAASSAAAASDDRTCSCGPPAAPKTAARAVGSRPGAISARTTTGPAGRSGSRSWRSRSPPCPRAGSPGPSRPCSPDSSNERKGLSEGSESISGR